MFLGRLKVNKRGSIRMHHVRIHTVINRLISFLYYAGFWHRGDTPAVTEVGMKLFYCIYYFLFLLSLIVGATSVSTEQAVFLVQLSISIGVLNIKLWFLVMKQVQIVGFLNRVCVFTIRYNEDAEFANDKLGRFAKFVIVFFVVVLICCFQLAFLPFFETQKTLVLQIGFPFDYKNNEIAFCFASLFIFSGTFLSMIAAFCSVIIWYLLLSFSLRYEVLGSEFKKIGRTRGKRMEKHVSAPYVFFQDLKESIDTQIHLRRYCTTCYNIQ